MKPTKPMNPEKRIGKSDRQSADKVEHADAMPRPIMLSFVIPCYNFENYMDACVSSMLSAGEDTEIVTVDDGSTDKTVERADRWAKHIPDTIRVIHQENSGHGGVVMAGVRAARGEYLKVVDLDNWLGRVALNLLMAKPRTFIVHRQGVDLVVCNYVYRHVLTGSRKVIRYLEALPMNKIMGWNSARRFGVGQNILMHSAVYRTQVLRDSGMEMPKYTLYVDDIFVYVPLSYVKKLYYLLVSLYRYSVGCEDQSANEKVMLGCLDQQTRVAKMMAEAYALPDEVCNPHLVCHMKGFLALIVTTSSIFAVLRGDRGALRMHDEMWEAIKAKSPKMAAMLCHSPPVWRVNVENPAARSVQVRLYRIAQRLYRFN